MPIWDDDAPAAGQAQGITQRIRAGNALPIISHSALFDLALFGHEAFKRYYAERVGYPYPNPADIGQLASYDRYTNRNSDMSCKEFLVQCAKNLVPLDINVRSGLVEDGERIRHVGAAGPCSEVALSAQRGQFFGCGRICELVCADIITPRQRLPAPASGRDGVWQWHRRAQANRTAPPDRCQRTRMSGAGTSVTFWSNTGTESIAAYTRLCRARRSAS